MQEEKRQCQESQNNSIAIEHASVLIDIINSNNLVDMVTIAEITNGDTTEYRLLSTCPQSQAMGLLNIASELSYGDIFGVDDDGE